LAPMVCEESMILPDDSRCCSVRTWPHSVIALVELQKAEIV